MSVLSSNSIIIIAKINDPNKKDKIKKPFITHE